MYNMKGKQDSEMQNKEQPGQLINSEWDAPMKVTRRKTDLQALKFCWILLTIWIGIGIYAFGSTTELPPEQKLNKNSDDKETYSYYSVVLDDKVFRTSDLLPLKIFHMMFGHKSAGFETTVGSLIFTIFWSFLFISIFGQCARILVKGILVFLCILLVLVIFASINGKTGSMLSFGVSVIILNVIVMFLKNCHKEIDLSCEIIKKASKICFSSYHFVLSFIQFFLSFSSLMFFLNNIRLLTYAYENKHLTSDATIVFFFLHLGNVCGWLWTSNFIYKVEDMILAGSFSTWYWTLNKEHVPKNTVLRFASIVRRFHLGTSAAGSIFMTIWESINIFLLVLVLASSSRSILSFIFCCFMFCGQCLFYPLIRGAYCFCALEGADFKTSIKKAYHLMRKNTKKFIVTYMSLLFFFVIPILAVLFSILMVYNELPMSLDVKEYDGYIIALVSSIMLAWSFFNLLKSAVNILLINTLIDYEQNDGSEARPYYMSDDLKKLMIH